MQIENECKWPRNFEGYRGKHPTSLRYCLRAEKRLKIIGICKFSQKSELPVENHIRRNAFINMFMYRSLSSCVS